MGELIWRGRTQALYGRLEGVFVPDMYEDLTTQRVLIMEWVEGRRLRTGTSGAPLPHIPILIPGPGTPARATAMDAEVSWARRAMNQERVNVSSD